MTKIRLPATTFVSTADAANDPLATALQEMAGNYFPSKIGPHEVEALLAYAQQVEFDPNAMATGYTSSRDQTVLAFVLDKTQPGWRRTDRHWPESAEGFGPHLLQPALDPNQIEQRDRVDTEWLAAVLLAVGADPWSPANMAHAPLSGEPLAHALRHGMGGLVRRLLAIPGAPSVHVLAAAPVMESLGVAGKESWLHCACREPDVLPLLPWFLDHGARPVPGGSHPLEQGAMPAIEEFARRGLMPTEPATVRRLESAWRQRLKAGEVSAAQHSSMTSLLRGKAPEDPLAAHLLQIMSASAWGKSDWNNPGPQNIGVEALTVQATIESGSLAGRWNGLGAHLLKHLRTTSCRTDRGVPAWSLAAAVQYEYVQGAWATLDPSSHLGLLSPTLGVEWRPGVRLDGLIALVVLGVESGQSEINEACELLGVSNPTQWGIDCAADAVAFTEALVPKRADKAAKVMASAWSAFLTRCPDALRGRPELARRLLASLHGNFTTAGLPAIDSTRAAAGRHLQGPLGGVVTRLTGANPFRRPPPASAREPADKALCVELALMFETALWFEALLSPEFGLEASHLERIQLWAQVRFKEADAGGSSAMAREEVTRVLTRAKEAVLTARLPPAAPRTARPRM